MTLKDFTKDVKFANWNTWYADLTIQIEQIRQLGYMVLFNPKQVNHYYSKIVNLFSTISFALEEPQQIRKRLNNIEDNIFSQKYLKDLNFKTITDYQRRIIRTLRNILEIMCSDLSEGGLLPKVERKKKYNPKKAMSEEVY